MRTNHPSFERMLGIFLILFVAVYALIMFAKLIIRAHGRQFNTAAINACKAFAEAEEMYRREKYGRDDFYASSFSALIGSKGELNLIDKGFSDAELGNRTEVPRAGYLFKVLTSQGVSAVGGRHLYFDEKGHMTLGYALVGCPSEYDSTGRLTYMINNNGTIYEKDLGQDTRAIVNAMTEFDPDTTWVPSQ